MYNAVGISRSTNTRVVRWWGKDAPVSSCADEKARQAGFFAESLEALRVNAYDVRHTLGRPPHTRKQVSAARRLQLCVRAWLPNKDLRERVVGVFGAARRGDVQEVGCYWQAFYGERCSKERQHKV